jgi:hypothetical protein
MRSFILGYMRWFILGYIFVLQALVGSLFMCGILRPFAELYFTFATLVVEVFIVLLGTFLALYGLVLERIWGEAQPLSLEEGGLSDYYSRCRASAKPITATMLIVIIGAFCITLLAQPLNEFTGTFGILLILQVSLLGGWLFVLFLWRLFSIAEKAIAHALKLKLGGRVEAKEKSKDYVR